MNDKTQHGRPRSRFSAKDIIGWMLIVATLVCLPMFLLKLWDAPEEPGEYLFYEGPVLPLTSLSGGEELEADRLVTLDFASYEDPRWYYEESVLVTDSYTLTNPTSENVTVELCWPIVTNLSREVPVISANGQTVDAQILPQTVKDSNLLAAENFEQFGQAYLAANFVESALAPTPEWDVPVKVYHFYNVAYQGTENKQPVLDIAYNMGKTTNLWVRTYEMFGSDRKKSHLSWQMGDEVWLYVIGDDLVDMTVTGGTVATLGVYQFEEIEGVTYELETYESTFMECLWEAAQDYSTDWIEEPGDHVELVTAQMRYDYAMKYIVGSEKQEPGGVRVINNYFDGLYHYAQLTNWLVPVEIPAGGSVTVSAAYRKEANHNADGQRHGYDIATSLGSNLNFQSQRVELVNTELVELAQNGEAQNMGFNLKTGILEVELDLTQEWYFVDLERVDTES